MTEIKARAERRIGEFSKELPKQERKRTDLSAPHHGKQTKTSIFKKACGSTTGTTKTLPTVRHRLKIN